MMESHEKILYHQIHPAKLATDFGTAFVAAALFWRHWPWLALVVGFVPSVVASVLLFRFADLTWLVDSRFGRYVRRSMSRTIEMVRLVGVGVFWAGAWMHRPLLAAGGFAVILAGWARGLVGSRETAMPRKSGKSGKSGMVALVACVLLGAAGCMPPSWGAAALLHPSRQVVVQSPRRAFDQVELQGQGVRLKGWWFHGEGSRRGTVIYLHGVADNRGSSVGVAEHFVPRGFDVLAYDSRAHGQSEGEACTYGFYEKQDLARVLDRVETRPVVILGTSLGGAVALQAAAEDRRIAGVVAVAAFSDLRTVAGERAPFFASKANIAEALRQAEQAGHFRVDEVSPVAAAARIQVPALIIHGDHDRETPAAHSLRIFAALHEPKRLILVPGRGHGDSLTADTWRAIDAWLDGALPRPR